MQVVGVLGNLLLLAGDCPTALPLRQLCLYTYKGGSRSPHFSPRPVAHVSGPLATPKVLAALP